MSFSIEVQSSARDRLLRMAHKFSTGFTPSELPGQPGIAMFFYVMNVFNIFDTGGMILLEDSGTTRLSLFQLWNNFFEELQHIVANASLFRLAKTSDTVATKASPKHIFLWVFNKLIYVGIMNLLFGLFSNVLTSLTLCKEKAFIAENDFSPLFFCPIFVLFWPLISFFFHWFG